MGWTSIYQIFWGSLGTRVLTHPHITHLKLNCSRTVLYSKVIHLPPINRHDTTSFGEPQAMMSMMPMMMGYLAMKWAIGPLQRPFFAIHDMNFMWILWKIDIWWLDSMQAIHEYMPCRPRARFQRGFSIWYLSCPVSKTVDLMAINGCESRPSDLHKGSVNHIFSLWLCNSFLWVWP